MKTYKVTLTVLLIALCSFFGMAQQSGELNIPLSKPGQKGTLKVDIKEGSIRVKGTNRSDILVKYEPSDAHNDEEGHSGKENPDGLKKIASGTMDLEISENGNTVQVESDSWNKGVDLIIEVPQVFDLTLSTYNNGVVVAENIEGALVIENYNGRIDAVNIKGSLVASTYNGGIKAVFNKVTPETAMAFTTYNGEVDLTFPASFKGNFKMKSENGEIFSGFDMNILQSQPVKKEDKTKGTYKVYLDDWVKASINGGGAEFMIKNYNGDIYLRKGS